MIFSDFLVIFVKSLTKEDNPKMVEVTEVCNLLMGMFQKIQYIAWILSRQKSLKNSLKVNKNQIKVGNLIRSVASFS